MSEEKEPLTQAPVETPKSPPKAPKKPRTKVAKVDLDALAKTAPEDAEYETRKALVKMPENLSPEEGVEWSEKALKKLAPEAVARIAYDLRFGSAKQSSEAADKVLRSLGMDRREAPQQVGQAQIIIQLGSAEVAATPWLQRVHKPKTEE